MAHEFRPGADAEELRDVVRDFLRSHSPEHAVRRIAESESGYDPAVWAQAAQELGLPGLVIPERLGGNGATPVELARTAEDLYAAWWQHISMLSAVPRVLVWDGEGAVGRWRARRPELTGACQAFRGTLGTKVVICKPGDPEAKGLVERFHDYIERAFLPGRVFSSPADFNTQLQDWLVRANHRQHPRAGMSPG
jgi:hypothetical protein